MRASSALKRGKSSFIDLTSLLGGVDEHEPPVVRMAMAGDESAALQRCNYAPVKVPLVIPASAARWRAPRSPQTHRTQSVVNAVNDMSCSASTSRSMW